MQTAIDLDAAVDAARTSYADARPQSEEWSRRAAAVLPGGNTRSVLHYEPFPFRVERADGKHLWDVDGHQYVDLLGNYTAGMLGHSPRQVRDAAHRAIDSGWSLGSVHTAEVRLAELLVDRFPSIERLRFTNSGTEANLMALAAATHHTGRSKIVVFENGYHGGVLTFSSGPNPVNVPHEWLILTYNDIDAAEAMFREHGPEIAAVLVEPMQGSGGCIPGDPAFLGRLRELCDVVGSVLIFDEVMTSRLSGGGAQQQLGIAPDMTTLGKYIAGGFTFGAFGGRSDIMAAFDPGAGGMLGHAGTFNNNVVTMAAGVAAMTEVLTPERLAETNARGDELRNRLADTFLRHRVDMCITGVGSLMNVHGTTGPVTQARDFAGADDRVKELLFFHLLDAGFYLARRGFIALSIEITDDDVDGVVHAVEAFCTTLTE